MKYKNEKSLKLMVIVFVVILSCAELNEEKKNCTSAGDQIFEKIVPQNRESSFSFCTEHSGRTCCTREHTEKIRKK
jgi:hypothetical protein